MQISVKAHSHTVQLRVLPQMSLGMVELGSDDGLWRASIPRRSFPSIPFNPGDVIVSCFALTRVGVEDPEEGNAAILLPRGNA